MSGTVWSAGPVPSSVWVQCPDGAMVALKLPSGERAAAGEQSMEMHDYAETWQRDTIKRCEHLSRSRGIFAEYTTETHWRVAGADHYRTLAYHCDRDCPEISHETRPAYDWEPSVASIIRMLLDATARGRSDLCRRCIHLSEPGVTETAAAA